MKLNIYLNYFFFQHLHTMVDTFNINLVQFYSEEINI